MQYQCFLRFENFKFLNLGTENIKNLSNYFDISGATNKKI